MATKILKSVFAAIAIISFTITVYASGPKEKSKKQGDQPLKHQCDSTCEKSYNVYPPSGKSLTINEEVMCKKALLEYLKAEREKERAENDQQHLTESSNKDIL